MSQPPFSDSRQQPGAQNVDARTASLLNRLATRRQSSPLLTSSNAARPSDLSKVESPAASPANLTPSKLGSVLAMNRASSPATISGARAGSDFQPKGTLAIQQFQPSNRTSTLAFQAKTPAQGSSGMGVQGRLVNLQIGSGLNAKTTGPGLGLRLSSASSNVSDEGHSSPLVLSRADGAPEQVMDQQLAGCSPSPQVLVRTKEEKAANPERLNLDRRKYVRPRECSRRMAHHSRRFFSLSHIESEPLECKSTPLSSILTARTPVHPS
jgi:hypothetical protein